MDICGGLRHDEIVYESKKCPLCEALAQIKQLESELQKEQEND